MTRKSIVAWTLVWTLAALLLVAWAALAEAEPAIVVPGLSRAEQYCRTLGIFAWRRATERSAFGYTRSDVLSQTRRYYTEENLDTATRMWHEAIVESLYDGRWSTPEVERQATEEACMSWWRDVAKAQQAAPTPTPGPRQPATKTYNPQLRY
jgi:hypothetical protein